MTCHQSFNFPTTCMNVINFYLCEYIFNDSGQNYRFIIYIFIRQKAEETSEKKQQTHNNNNKKQKKHKKHCQSGRTSEHLFKELKLFKQFIYVRTKKTSINQFKIKLR